MRRDGFTLVEMLIAMVVLTIVLAGLGRFMGAFQHDTTRARIRLVATAVAHERLELVRADPRYDQLRATYQLGAGGDTTGFPGFPQMRRRTLVVRDQSGTPPRDLTTVTVVVTHPATADTVALTSVVARP